MANVRLSLCSRGPSLVGTGLATHSNWGAKAFPNLPMDSSAGIDAQSPGLQQAALRDILRRGYPLMGHDSGCSEHNATCDWMSRFPDTTEIVHLNIPGVHDAATGNYSDATQQSLIRYTGPIPEAKVYRCQERSLFEMLNDGIRMFDMRFAYNPGNDTMGFWHSKALLAPTTTMDDVLFSFYSWLDKHPSETLLMSFKLEGGTGTPHDEKLERMVYDTFSKATKQDPNSFLKTRYWYEPRGSLGTLGEARGKMILLQRFAYDLLKPTPSPNQLTGIDLGPSKWVDNGKDIELVYNAETGATAFIEDYYSVQPLPGLTNQVDGYITSKFNATVAHLEKASTQHPDQLFISFASAAYIQGQEISMNPRLYALGDENAGVLGINHRLLQWLRHRRGERFGVILYDFYDAVPGLIEATIGLHG